MEWLVIKCKNIKGVFGAFLAYRCTLDVGKVKNEVFISTSQYFGL
jgi:hypothetical protein